MPEMSVAAAACHLGTDHSVVVVADLVHAVGVDGSREARPARARLVLGLGGEERLPAGRVIRALLTFLALGAVRRRR